MRGIITILLLVLVMVSLYGCKLSNYDVYDAGDFSFEKPKDWEPTKLQEGNIVFVDKTGSKIIAVNNLAQSGSTFEQTIELIKNSLSSKLTNANLLNEEDMILNGMKAHKLVFYYDSGSSAEQFKHSVIIIDDKDHSRALFFSLTTYIDAHESNLVVLYNLLSTLKFDN